MSETPDAVRHATFTLFGVELKCFVLDDGRRVVDKDSIAAVLEAMESGWPVDSAEIERFDKWQRGLAT